MQYMPFASDVELPFYMALASIKINHDKLDASARKLLGRYEIRPADPSNASCRVQIHGNALTSDETPPGYYRAEGIIKNVNTIEEYRGIDKAHMLHQAGRTIWDAINDGSIYSCPSLLASFVVLSFADLKSHKFHSWFAFPALHSTPPWVPEETDNRDTVEPSQDGPRNPPLARSLSHTERSSLVDAVKTWSIDRDARQRGFFLARKSLDAGHGDGGGTREASTTAAAPQSSGSRVSWTIAELSAYEDGFFNGARTEDRYVCFADPSNNAHAPGWMLRNLLVLMKRRWGLDRVQVLLYRDAQSYRDSRSVVLRLRTKPEDSIPSQEEQDQMPKVTGWERNPAGKLTGRTVNLADYLDPKRYSHLNKRPFCITDHAPRLADQSVNLNLKLMKWRIAPNLDLDKIKDTKCLLLGAGTLGSYVARNLMACIQQMTDLAPSN
ncbi:hypothetical protein PHISP_05159 [Aspergillus sp. HF37]|nr:hypothetical protein PHISP_05159 [Aspergillus sp. HF37]